jgi:hypothetical protein
MIKEDNQRHILRYRRRGTTACPVSILLGEGGKSSEIVFEEEIYGQTKAAKAGQNSLVPA